MIITAIALALAAQAAPAQQATDGQTIVVTAIPLSETERRLADCLARRCPLADPGGSYRVERFTYTSLWEQRLGTRLRQRSANARVESLDLSAD